MNSSLERFFISPWRVFSAAVVLRFVLLSYGHYQDEHSALKYTDIDYYVFTDAARYVSRGESPYSRDTYRYTPLLAWILVPTTWSGGWFDFGKILFALSDVGAGLFIYLILSTTYAMPTARALKFTSIWLLNPMVAQISTRGSSEGLVGLFVSALLWAALNQKHILAGILLGSAVHLKIYPFIYAASIFCWLDGNKTARQALLPQKSIVSLERFRGLITPPRVSLTLASGITFMALNLCMFTIYGWPFLDHTYLYHVVRTDHRHNFSVYNMLLYLKASPAAPLGLAFERLAFLPQLTISLIAISTMLAKNDLTTAMFAQTFSFVAFNKVCTSQYSLWYMVFLPLYLPFSSMLARPRLGWTSLTLWVVGQGFWLQQAYQLEFLGNSSFFPGLWLASLLFFAINAFILGIIISDGRRIVPSSTDHVKVT